MSIECLPLDRGHPRHHHARAPAQVQECSEADADGQAPHLHRGPDRGHGEERIQGQLPRPQSFCTSISTKHILYEQVHHFNTLL